MFAWTKKHLTNNAGDSNVSKMTIIAIAFVVGAILLVMMTSAFRGPINRWLSTVTNDWFDNENGKFVSNPSAYQVYYGDLNSDGIVDETDINIIRDFIAAGREGFTEDQLIRADVNEDGTINTFDITYLRRYLDGGYEGFETLPPAPENSPFIP